MNGDIKFFALVACFLTVVGGIAYGLGAINQGLKDSKCHTASIISSFQIFNANNTQDLYDVADHYVGYNGTTITHLVQQGWYMVKIAPNTTGAFYPLLGLKFESLRVCK